MSSLKIDNATINRVFEQILNRTYHKTPVDKLQRKLRSKYADLLKENKLKKEELKTLTTLDLL